VIKKADIKIQLLEQFPEHFAQVAAWHHQECERQGLQSTIATRQQRLLLHVQHNAIPKTIIALKGKTILGCVSLVNYRYQTDNSVLIPVNSAPIWLSNLFVVDEKRHQGLGNLLIEAAKKIRTGFWCHRIVVVCCRIYGLLSKARLGDCTKNPAGWQASECDAR